MDVKAIVKKYLIENGYTGLQNDLGECGCELNDLMPCGSEGIEDCTVGYKVFCTKDCDHEGSGIGNWHIQAEEPSLIEEQ